MSNYRDDTNEIATAGDKTWMGLSSVTEELARVSAAVFFGLLTVHSVAATASDETFGRQIGNTAELAQITDQVLDSFSASVLVLESVRVSDSAIERLRVLTAETATATDTVIESPSSTIIETATASDEVIGARTAHVLVVETARASDTALQAAVTLIEESAVASDSARGTLRARVLVESSAVVSGEHIDTAASHALVVESARVGDAAWGQLHAADLVTDNAVAEGVPVGGDDAGGQAWTANTDNWAMSRYAPYSFVSLAVIDGQLYGISDEGVHMLQGVGEVLGSITTGPLDIGRGQLVHPVAAYLEYELDGDNKTAELDVTTTQSGEPRTYTYALPAERAAALTNGRFVLGRGLRGRHFSFTLRMLGTRGHINDLSVNTAQTKRRV